MQWIDIMVPCANEGCDKKVRRKGKMVLGRWVDDEENLCCCSPECHKKHDEELKKRIRECGDISDS